MAILGCTTDTRTDAEKAAEADLLAESQGVRPGEAGNLMGEAFLLEIDKERINVLSCEDSDGGDNRDTKGIVTIEYTVEGSSEVYTARRADWCMVREWYCTEGLVRGEPVLRLAYGFDSCSGNTCSGGQCVDAACMPYTCMPNEWTQDEVFEFSDKCWYSTLSQCLVFDHDCDGDIDVVDVQYIASTCVESNEPGCSDSDGGNDPFVFGETEGWNLDHTARTVMVDACNAEGLLVERYCGQDDVIMSEYGIVCEFGCEQGACLQQPSCSDSDGGIVFDVQGECTLCTANNPVNNSVISGGCGGVSDYCVDENTVKECYCDGNNLASVVYQCSGMCLNGSCIESGCPAAYSVIPVGLLESYYSGYNCTGDEFGSLAADGWLTWDGEGCLSNENFAMTAYS
ncbi:hypothetical protein KY320_03155, partial [Candidatus Woesearchaeota archaeon]|nr:hypothetical protein [Candidatus Woesearchaeota archaeon]